MDKGRILLKEGKDAELKAHLETTLPFRIDEFKKLFEETKDAVGGRLFLRMCRPCTHLLS